MKKIPAIIYDGIISKRIENSVDIENNKITLNNNGNSYLLANCEISAPLSKGLIVLMTPAGERIEFYKKNLSPEQQNLVIKKTDSLLEYMQEQKTVIIIGVIAIFTSGYFLLNYGVPFIGKQLAKTVPVSVKVQLDESIMIELEKTILKESKLSDERIMSIGEEIASKNINNVRLYINYSEHLGANAFALSGETVVLLDDLIELYENNNHLVAIYFHEVGHLRKNHLISHLLATFSLNAIIMFTIGDMNAVFQHLLQLGTNLVNLSYSRSAEHEADKIAAEILLKNNLPVTCFTEALKILTDQSNKKHNINGDSASYLSTHPNLKERIELLKSKYPNGFREVCPN